MNEHRPTVAPARGVWRSPVILDDLTADLVWPRLLKAGPLALRPSRLFLAFFYLVGLGGLVALSGAIDGEADRNVLAEAGQRWAGHLGELVSACAGMDAGAAARAVFELFIGTVWRLVSTHPLVGLVMLPLIVVWTTLMGGAISRIAAMDFAQGVGQAWPEGFGYAAGRWSSFAGSVLGPVLLVYFLVLVMAVGGWALFNLAGVNVAGGLLWFVFLIGGAVAALIMIAMTLGGPMLVPAVACEGTDAIDAIQHAYSYVFAKPLRLLVYGAILVLQFFALALVVGIAVGLLIFVAQFAASAWVNEAGREVIRGTATVVNAAGEVEAGPEGTWRYAAGIVRFWTGIPLLLASAFAVSYFWCAATVLYLAMRRVCDGQDMSEVWVDTIVPGTMAERRAAAPAGTGTGDVIVDNGPADET